MAGRRGGRAIPRRRGRSEGSEVGGSLPRPAQATRWTPRRCRFRAQTLVGGGNQVAVKLHRCSSMWVKIEGHPCWRVQKALDEQGIDYELVKGPLRRGKRD